MTNTTSMQYSNSNPPFAINQILILTSDITPLDKRQGQLLSGSHRQLLTSSLMTCCQSIAYNAMAWPDSVPAKPPQSGRPALQANRPDDSLATVSQRLLMARIEALQPTAILSLGPTPYQQLTALTESPNKPKSAPKIKNSKYTTAFQSKTPILKTISRLEFSSSSKLLEFHEDLEVFRRILYMRFLEDAASIFTTVDLKTHIRIGNLRRLLNSNKLHTEEFNQAANS
jgi:hypothetical protein